MRQGFRMAAFILIAVFYAALGAQNHPRGQWQDHQNQPNYHQQQNHHHQGGGNHASHFGNHNQPQPGYQQHQDNHREHDRCQPGHGPGPQPNQNPVIIQFYQIQPPPLYYYVPVYNPAPYYYFID